MQEAEKLITSESFLDKGIVCEVVVHTNNFFGHLFFNVLHKNLPVCLFYCH